MMLSYEGDFDLACYLIEMAILEIRYVLAKQAVEKQSGFIGHKASLN